MTEEVVWEYDHELPYDDDQPRDAAAAGRRLLEGNATFARFFEPRPNTCLLYTSRCV